MQTNNAVDGGVLARRSCKHQSELNSHDEFMVRSNSADEAISYSSYTVIYVGFDCWMCF